MGSAERAKHTIREWLRPRERRLDWLMGLLGLLFLLVVLAEPLSDDPALTAILAVTSYLLWAAFIAEFLLRLWLAPDRGRFLRRNWWRILLLVVPFLRFLRLLQSLRVAAIGRGIVSVVRGSSSAARVLSGRLAWLVTLTALVVVAASYVLYLTGAFPSYVQALHRSALSTISGEPLGAATGLGQILDVILAAYSVIVFATLAGSIGAYFLGDRTPRRRRDQDGER